MAWNSLDMEPAFEAARQLQPLLTDLVGLSLVGKQAHWTVVGTDFPQVHEQLDVVVELARTAADRFAERMVALGALPDGQPQTVATTSVTTLPLEWQPTGDAVEAIANSIRALTGSLRKALHALAEADPVSEGIVIDVLEQLEQQHWMLRAQLA